MSFRLNMSHGIHDEIAEKHRIIRQVEEELQSPIAILADLQGAQAARRGLCQWRGRAEEGAAFRLDLMRPRVTPRASLPHPEIFAALEPGATLLVNDGKIRLRVTECGSDFAETEVIRRDDLQPQGRQRARRGAAGGGAVGKGPRGSGIRLRTWRRLARA